MKLVLKLRVNLSLCLYKRMPKASAVICLCVQTSSALPPKNQEESSPCEPFVELSSVFPASYSLSCGSQIHEGILCVICMVTVAWLNLHT